MKRCTLIPRRTEGKTWHVVGPLSGGYLKIEMLLTSGMRPAKHIRVMARGAYESVARYPTELPVYRYEDYLSEVGP